MKLSIIVVSWNTLDLLDRCLRTIPEPGEGLLGGEIEVFVVDNASTDNSAQHIRNHFPWVRLIENRENVGFARGNNQAMYECSGEYILLLNPDTELDGDCLEALVSFADDQPGAGAVGPRILNPDGSLQVSCFPTPTLTREFWLLFHFDALIPYGIYRMDRWILSEAKEVDVLLGACLLIRREVIEQTGHLDENYFMYSEEVDLCHRVRKAGWSIAWVPWAQIVHHGGQSTRQVRAEMFMQLYQGKLQFFRKNHGRLAGQVYKIILLCASLSRLLLTPLAWLERPARRRNHLTLASQYWQLVTELPNL